jgi:RNA polymerase sigma factor (sigma-70 family)
MSRPTASRPRGVRERTWNPSWLDALASQQAKGYHGVYDIVVDAIDGLTDKQRDAVNGVFWERLTQEEVGRRYGVTQRAISYRVARAMKQIRKALEDGGYSP